MYLVQIGPCPRLGTKILAWNNGKARNKDMVQVTRDPNIISYNIIFISWPDEIIISIYRPYYMVF